MKTKPIITLLFLACWLTSCHKDSDEVIQEEIPDPPVVLISTRLVTTVDPSNLDAVHGVQHFSNQQRLFDKLPFSVTTGALIDRDHELLSLAINDYTILYQANALVANDINYYHWSIPSLTTVTANTTSEKIVTVNANCAIHIGANALQLAGEQYTGDYNIQYADLGSQPNAGQLIPSHVGIAANGLYQSVLPDQCVYITASTSAGEPLTFNDNAHIQFADSQANQWYFHVGKGIWQQSAEQTLLLLDRHYFSTGVARDVVRQTGELVINGKLIPNFPITVKYDNQERTIYTTNAGQWAVLIPANTTVQVLIKTACADERHVFTTNSNDQFLPIELSLPGMTAATIEGSLRDCQATRLSGGVISYGDLPTQLIYNSDGEINFNLPMCEHDSVTVTAYDLSNGASGPTIAWEVSNNVRMNSVFACELAKHEYLSLNVAGEQKMYWDMHSLLVNGNRMALTEGAAIPDFNFELYISDPSAGMIADQQLNIVFEDMALGTKGYSLFCPTATSGCGFSAFELTHYPDQAGEWIRGSFEGEFWIKTFTPLTAGYRPVRGEFQVYREF